MSASARSPKPPVSAAAAVRDGPDGEHSADRRDPKLQPPARGRARRPRRWVRRYVPPQHGAWAMLLLPFAVGVLESSPSPVHVPLLIAWVAAYLTSYYGFVALKTRRPARVRDQLVLYGSVAAVAGTMAVSARPTLIAFAPLFAGLVTVNGWFAWHKNERALANDLVSVAQACLMVPAAAVAGGSPVTTGWSAAFVLFAYFAGTACYVKTMIRERGSVEWRRLSVAFHACAAVAVGALAWQLGALFAWFLARAAIFPRFRMTPKAVGLVEVANSAALLVMVPGFA